MALFLVLVILGFLINPQNSSGVEPQNIIYISAIISVIYSLLKNANKQMQSHRRLEEYKRILTAQLADANKIINNHASELSIRRNQLTVKAAYGLIDDKKWLKEIDLFILNVIQPNVTIGSEEVLNAVVANINFVTKDYQSSIAPFSRKMSPTDYEQLVAKSLIDHGWDARMTIASRDQGIDVIAEKSGIKVVIQCKLYSNNVGNSAIQEIIAGQIFESADFAAVVTNADFTKSARQLASSSRVFLLHHDQLGELETMCEQPFW